MLNRPHDVPYCGVSQGKIHYAKPPMDPVKLGLLVEWITERYNIHLKKDVMKLPAPWTSNTILQNVKFTNVRREHDRATKWAIEHICNRTDLSLTTRIINLVLFRLYNKWETCELINLPASFSGVQNEYGGWMMDRKKILQAKQTSDSDYVFFTSAFNTGGMKAASGRLTGEVYIPARPMALIDWMIGKGLFDDIHSAESPREVCNILMDVPGIGEFLSYQMFVDFTYCPDYKFSENEFTIAGPGCSLGLSMLFTDPDGLTDEELLFWLRDNQDEVFGTSFTENLMTDLDPKDRTMNVMSLENCFCEFSKYVRCNEQVKEGKKPRARVSFDGTGEDMKRPKKVKNEAPNDPNRTIPYMGKRITDDEQLELHKERKRVDSEVRRTDLYEDTLFDPKPEYTGSKYGHRESRTMYQLLGTNGSGKSTIPKGLVERDTDAYLLSTEFAWLSGNMSKGFQATTKKSGFATVLPNLGIILIGDYTPGTNIAGCDTLVRATMEQALDIIMGRPEFDDYHIMMEGVVLSSSRWHIDRFKEMGMTPHMLFMDTPLEVCMERLVKRNAAQGKTPNTKNVESKWEETRVKAERCIEGTNGYGGVRAVWVDHSMDIPTTVQWFINNYL